MAISGFLSELSLPEIFQLLEQGKKTGRLTIKAQSPHSSLKGENFYIWFKQGLIVAAANRLDGQGCYLSSNSKVGSVHVQPLELQMSVQLIKQPDCVSHYKEY
jgi:hypothetical protein